MAQCYLVQYREGCTHQRMIGYFKNSHRAHDTLERYMQEEENFHFCVLIHDYKNYQTFEALDTPFELNLLKSSRKVQHTIIFLQEHTIF